MKDVAKSFKLEGFDLNDDPKSIYKYTKSILKKPTLLLNTNSIGMRK